jgi:hypothetical protein
MAAILVLSVGGLLFFIPADPDQGQQSDHNRSLHNSGGNSNVLPPQNGSPGNGNKLRELIVRVVDAIGIPLPEARILLSAVPLQVNNINDRYLAFSDQEVVKGSEVLARMLQQWGIKPEAVIQVKEDGTALVQWQEATGPFVLTALVMDEGLSLPLVHRSESHTVTPNEREVSLQVHLPPRVIIGGKLIDDVGQSASGVRIAVIPDHQQDHTPGPNQYAYTRTSSAKDGSYRIIAYLRPANYELHVGGSDYDQPPYVAYSSGTGSELTPRMTISVSPEPAEQSFRLDPIRLQRICYTRFSGTIALEGGHTPTQPRVEGRTPNGKMPTGVLNQDGSFFVSMGTQSAGRYVLRIKPHPDYVTIVIPVVDPNPTRQMNQVLNLGRIVSRLKPGFVSGRIEHAQQSGVTQLQISETGVPSGSSEQDVEFFRYSWVVSVRSDGYFEFRSDPGCAYRIKDAQGKKSWDAIVIDGQVTTVSDYVFPREQHAIQLRPK